MPLGGKLADAEIELIARWIDEGAAWPDDGGAAAGLKRPLGVRPAGEAARAARRAQRLGRKSDRPFVLARLEQERLAPSPRASKETLLRGLSLDLIGLPPTLDEIDAYLHDDGEDAYQKQVRRLLDSPHYGERWGRYWLDAARYADSDGFEKDKPRKVWFYRDWVVKALNRDMPYDRFVIEQIAGDLLPNATQDQVVATGFLRNSMINEEGGANPEQFRMEAMFDRMDAVGKAVLGLTVQCAQCHNHKFDPIRKKTTTASSPSSTTRTRRCRRSIRPKSSNCGARIFSEIAALEQDLQRRAPDWRQRMAAWEREIADNQPDWHVLDAAIELGSGEKYEMQPDKSILAQGYAPTRSVVSPEARTDLQGIRAVRLELLTDPRLRLAGPGRSFMGPAGADRVSRSKPPADDPEKKKKLKIASATADVNPPMSEVDLFLFPDKDNKRRVLGEVDFAIDGFEMSAWSSIDGGPGRRNQPRKAVFQLAKPAEIDGPVVLTFNLVMKHGGWNSDDNQSLNLGRYRFSVTTDENAVADPLPAAVRHIVSQVPRERRTPEQEAAVFRFWRTQVPEWEDENRTIEALWAQHPEGSTQLVLSERAAPRMTHVLQRGDFLRPVERVQPGAPAFLHPLKTAGRETTRLDFAVGWWTAIRRRRRGRSSTAFGRGTSASSGRNPRRDLGRQAPAPSHPELLDWLAVELMENDWSLKRIHRLIVSSETYRQSSKAAPELYARDPPEPSAGARRAVPRGRRGRARRGFGRERPAQPADRRRAGLPSCAGIPVPAAGELRPQALVRRNRAGTLSPVALYVPLPLGSLSGARYVRHPERQLRLRQARPLEYAVAGPRYAERNPVLRSCARARPAHGRGRRRRCRTHGLRLPPRLDAAPEHSGENRAVGAAQHPEERIAAGGLDAWRLTATDRGSLPAAQAGELAAWTAVSRVLLNLDETITRE